MLLNAAAHGVVRVWGTATAASAGTSTRQRRGLQQKRGSKTKMLDPKFLLLNTLMATTWWLWTRSGMKKIQKRWDDQRTELETKFGKRCKRVECADGFSMSVQAGTANYSTPRSALGPYTAVEVGFPSRADYLLEPYFDGDSNTEDMTKGVYAWVPVQVVTNVLAKHGGMISGEVPDGVIPLTAKREQDNLFERVLSLGQEQENKDT